MVNVDPELIAIYQVFEFTGIFLMGLMGATIARQREFDVFGFLFLAFFAALGGGIIRDAMIMEGAVSAAREPIYLALAFAGALVGFFTKLSGRVWELFQVHADAIVLGVWAVAGASKALAFGLPSLTAIFMGVLTATGGGIIRDVTLGQTPQVFVGKRLYAAPALVSAVIMVASFHLGHVALGMIVAPIPAAALAILSYWRGWRIPFHAEFAPVNVKAAQLREAAEPLETKTRAVARDLEPQAVRELRHAALEKAGQEVDKMEQEAESLVEKHAEGSVKVTEKEKF